MDEKIFKRTHNNLQPLLNQIVAELILANPLNSGINEIASKIKFIFWDINKSKYTAIIILPENAEEVP